MTDSGFAEPVRQLLTLGDLRGEREWRDYTALGIGPEHVPDLCRMIEDDELNEAPWESAEVWAPAHAWRAVGQLRAEGAVDALLGILWRAEDGDDWVGEEVPIVLGMIGPAAVPQVAAFLDEPLHGVWPRVIAARALAEIGQRHPGARDDCIRVLSGCLEDYAAQSPELNAFLIDDLVDLKAVEAAPLMERAFAADRVELFVQGDWEDVQILLGLLDARLTPAPEYHWFPELQLPELLLSKSATTSKSQWKQEQAAERRRQGSRRAKRKQQRKARKKQRKRK